MTDEIRTIAESPNPADERRAQLAALIPEAFSEGRLDVAALKRALGEAAVIDGGERYALTWAGKAEAYKVLQTPSTATLRPQRDKSVNFDQAQHVFIEGENLEVLKVLQKAYFGKVKLIYIDPPYNTGSDSFIYPDRFQESKEDYLRRINDLADDGTLMREGFFRKNSRENGHYHSNWLSMMLPRLYIARNLLREDGVIFVSCDDNEAHNLRCLMNEVFGEENFVACISWQNVYGGGAKVKTVVSQHEYVLVFARSKDALGEIDLPPNPEARKMYKERDEKFETRGPYFTQPLATTSMDTRDNLRFPILWQGKEIWPEKQWQWSRERVEQALANDELVIRETETGWSVRYKQYLRDEDGNERSAKLYSIMTGPWSQDGTNEIREFFGDGKVFPFPKPSELIKTLISAAWRDPNCLILDFFAGSLPTAQALLKLNQCIGGNRKLIAIQLPEPIEEGSAARTAGFETIADIGRARFKKVIDKIVSKVLPTTVPKDIGFKSFLLAPSNFKQWRGDGIDTPEQLAEQIELFVKAEKEGA
ncbi:MAG: site-specific DNA-methyltransferase [Pseudomonadota bacterium]|nr:site-specific DNA-methyltransferase [Pseudomonadota bacterium]